MDVHSSSTFSNLCEMGVWQGADTYMGGQGMRSPSVGCTFLICWGEDDIDIGMIVLADGRTLLHIWKYMDLGCQLELEMVGDPDNAVNVKVDINICGWTWSFLRSSVMNSPSAVLPQRKRSALASEPDCPALVNIA